MQDKREGFEIVGQEVGGGMDVLVAAVLRSVHTNQ